MERNARPTAPFFDGHTTFHSPDSRTVRVGTLMSGIGPVVSVTAPLRDVAAMVQGPDAAALVIGLSEQPLGLVTESALADVAARHPQQWQKKRCAALIGLMPGPGPLAPADPIEEALDRYRCFGAQPLLVLEEDRAVGILYPDPVFSWCLTQPSAVFDALGLGRDPR